MTRRGAIGLLAGGTSISLTGCGPLADKKSYRFRMTAEIQTPQGLKTGSGVMELTAYHKFKFTSEESSISGTFRGQAVIVELPDGPIFVLLTEKVGIPFDQYVTLALAHVAGPDSHNDYVAVVGKLGGWHGGAKADLPRNRWPIMVRFRDVNDPQTVEGVDPEAIGVKRIALETTRDDVTTGIEKRLGWLHKKGQPLDSRGPRFSPSPSLGSTLYPEMFSSEIGK